MIAVEFDRAKMRSRLAVYSAILVIGIVLPTLAMGLILSHFAFPLWEHRLILLLFILIVIHVIDYARWVGALARGLRRKDPAITINVNGVVDNASDYCLGQLAWDEIEKMYPWDWNSRLFLDWWSRMPVIFRQRGIVILLKGGVDLQHLLQDKSWIVKLLMKHWSNHGRKRWLFIPEMLLDVTSDELMQRLNNFYVAQVREAA